MRIASLDGLRGLAAAAVVYAHVKYFYPSTRWWIDVTVGDEAVALFFSLSGFLMALLYGGRRFDARDFLVHRFARIYPVYFVAVLVVAVLSAAFGDAYLYPIFGLAGIAKHLLMLGSSGVFWSIPPEIQFYLFFLLIWLWFLNPARYQWVAVLTTAFLVIAGFFGFPGPGILLTSKLPYFLFGCLAGRFYAHQKSHPEGFLVGFATLALLAFFFLSRLIHPQATSFWGLNSAFTATVIVYLAACGSNVSSAILASPPLTFLGRISFSLYLFHLPVIFLVTRFLDVRLGIEAGLIFAIFVAVVVAWISNTLIENPARRFFVDLWRGRKERLPVAAE